MPGFCFSPTMIGQSIHVILKSNGTKLSGVAIEANPTELVLKNPKNENLIRINKDDVSAVSGLDDVNRKPDPLRLHVNRCFNVATRCNGVKRISIDPLSTEDYKICPAFNEYCELLHKNFFELSKTAQLKMMNGVMIGEFPQKQTEEEEQ